jgi:F-type H+-transporting ATPase subunit gamma
MSSTKELRGRIRSIKNTSKITKAMELVSAAKMRRAQEKAISGRDYSQLANKVLENISSAIDPGAHPLLSREEKSKEAILLVTTNRGLCGSLNTNLFKKAFGFQGEVSFITLGKKGQVFAAKSGKNLEADFELLEHPTFDLARTISQFLTNGFLTKQFDRIHVLYTSFQSTLKQEATLRQILPIIDIHILEKVSEKAENELNEYLFEPSADQVLETILPHYLLMEIYQILQEAAASEHSARMVAMKNASDNASDLVDDLTLAYNQVRQAGITNEILDISTAAIALN